MLISYLAYLNQSVEQKSQTLWSNIGSWTAFQKNYQLPKNSFVLKIRRKNAY